MRTTVNIPDALLAQAKARCVEKDLTLGDVISDGLRVLFFQTSVAQDKRPASLKTFRGNGLHAGVDLDSNAALLDSMEAR